MGDEGRFERDDGSPFSLGGGDLGVDVEGEAGEGGAGRGPSRSGRGGEGAVGAGEREPR